MDGTKKVYITQCDLFRFRVYDEVETTELFGEDMLEDYGTTIPSELLERYKQIEADLNKLQDDLKVFYDQK